MAVFDTSALVPLFIQGHPHSAAAEVAFNDADLVLLHPCVIEEFTRVIRRLHNRAGDKGNERARAALQSLVDEPRVRIQGEMDYTSALDLYQEDGNLSFTDAVVSAFSKAFDGSKPVAFDDRINKGSTKPARSRRQASRP